MSNTFKMERETVKALSIALALSVLVMPFPAMAQASADGMAQSILSLLTGTLAKTFAAIGFVICGYMYIAGRMQAMTLISVIVGCLIIFSSEWIVTQIAG